MEKTKIESSKKSKSIMVAISVGAFVLLTFTIGFLQIFFPTDSQTVVEARQIHKQVKKERNTAEDALKKLVFDYNQKTITKEFFDKEIASLIPQYKILQKRTNELYNNLISEKNDQRIIGFKNTRTFFANIGTPFVSVSLGIVLLFFFLKEKDLMYKKIMFSFSFVGIIIGSFYLSWAFSPESDLPMYLYVIFFIILSIVGYLISYYIIKYFYYITQTDLKLSIQSLLHFIVSDVKQRYISEQDHSSYVKDYINEIDKLSDK